jgi:hypothetical protein
VPPPPSAAEIRAETVANLEDMPLQLESAIAREVDGFDRFAAEAGDRIHVVGDEAVVEVYVRGSDQPQLVTVPEAAAPDNIQRVGLGLVRDFPVSLELAGVILLLAMYGAVVLARRQIELSEQEKTARSGISRGGTPA